MVDDDKKMVLDLREWHHDRGDKETAIIKKKPFEALSDIRFLKFDNQGKTLVAVAETHFLIINLDVDREHSFTYKIRRISDISLERILQIQINHDDQGELKIYLACKKRNMRKIHVFEHQENQNYIEKMLQQKKSKQFQSKYLEDSELRKMSNLTMKEIEYKSSEYEVGPHVVVINYDKDLNNEYKIAISKNMSIIIFSNQGQHFLLDNTYNLKDKGFHQRNLSHLGEKFIRYLYEDKDGEHGGFYIVASKAYDKRIRIFHSHKPDLNIKLTRDVENCHLGFFDLDVEPIKELQKENQETVRFQLFGIDHGKFSLDTADITFRQIKGKDKQIDENLHEVSVEVIDNRQTNFTFEDIGSFSMEWPFLAFADRQGMIFVANAFDKHMIRQYKMNHTLINMYIKSANKLAPNMEQNSSIRDGQLNAKVELTFITVDYNLFTVCQYTYGSQIEDCYYVVFKKDLKHHNIFNLKQFKKEVVHEHKHDEPHIKETTEQDQDSDESFSNEQPQLIDQCGELILWYSVKDLMKAKRKDPKYEKMDQNSQDFQHFPRQIYVRDKGETGNNEKLIIMIQHGENLYKHVHADDVVSSDIEFVAQTSRTQKFHVSPDNILYYMTEKENLVELQKDNKQSMKYKISQQIMAAKIGFMKVHTSLAYQETVEADQVIKSFSYDQTQQKFCILTKDAVKYEAKERNFRDQKYRFKIYDIKQKKILLDITITDPVFKGIIMSGNYNLLDGHIYFRNTVIKIRYDIVEQQQKTLAQFDARSLLDIYDNVLILQTNWIIDSEKLLVSPRGHRLAFLSQDVQNQISPNLLDICPFLHERRLYLDSTEANCAYFTTSIEFGDEITQYNEKVWSFLKNTKNGLKYYNEKSYRLHTSVVQKSVGGLRRQETKIGLQAKSEEHTQEDKVKHTLIIRFNLTTGIYYVYAQNGILKRRVNFNKYKLMYGEPVSASPNGLYLIFRRRNLFLQHMSEHEHENNHQSLHERAMTYTIMEVTPFKLKPIKHVDVKKGIKDCIQHMSHMKQQQMKKLNEWLTYENDDDFDQWLQDHRISLFINNKCDTVMTITPLHNLPEGEEDEQLLKDLKIQKATGLNVNPQDMHKSKKFKFEDQQDKVKKNNGETIVYFESGQTFNEEINNLSCEYKNKFNKESQKVIIPWNDKRYSPNGIEQRRSVITLGTYESNPLWHDSKVELTEQYLIFYNQEVIGPLPLDQEINVDRIQRIALQLQKKDGDKRYMGIQQIITSNAGERISLIIDKGNGFKKTVVWDLEHNHELAHYTTNKTFVIKSDFDGKPFIVQEDGKVMFLLDHTLMNSFRYGQDEVLNQNFIESEYYKNNTESIGLGVAKGTNVDWKNHNWMLFDEYLALPFSYLSFAMLDKFEQNDIGYYDYAGHKFDNEPFDYLFNMSTGLMDSKILNQDYENLKVVLNNMLYTDKDSMNILNWCYEAPYIPDNAIEVLPETESRITKFLGLGEQNCFSCCGDSKIQSEDDFNKRDKERQETEKERKMQVLKDKLEYDKEKFKISALHTSILSYNDVVGANILLNYMSKSITVDQILARKYTDLYKQLVGYPNFPQFISTIMMCQTYEMRGTHQQSLQAGSNEDESIYRINPVRTSIFTPQVQKHIRIGRSLWDSCKLDCLCCYEEEDKFKTMPVDIYLVGIGWAYDKDNGIIKSNALMFLEEVLDQNKPELYNEPAIQVLIHTLYKEFSLYNIIMRLFFLVDLANIILINVWMSEIVKQSKYEQLYSQGATYIPWNKGTIYYERLLGRYSFWLNLFVAFVTFMKLVGFIVMRCQKFPGKFCSSVSSAVISQQTFLLTMKTYLLISVIRPFKGKPKGQSMEEFRITFYDFFLTVSLLWLFYLLQLTELLQSFRTFTLLQGRCLTVSYRSIPFLIVMILYIIFFTMSFQMIGFSFFTFDYKKEKFYDEKFAEYRVKYNVTTAQLKKDGAFQGKGDWYDKFSKDAEDDFGYFTSYDSLFFMFKYWGGMVPEQGALPLEPNKKTLLDVKITFNILNTVMPIIMITVMLNYLIAIMSSEQSKLEELGESQRFHAQLNYIMKNIQFFQYFRCFIPTKKCFSGIIFCKQFWGKQYKDYPYILAAYQKDLEKYAEEQSDNARRAIVDDFKGVAASVQFSQRDYMNGMINNSLERAVKQIKSSEVRDKKFEK